MRLFWPLLYRVSSPAVFSVGVSVAVGTADGYGNIVLRSAAKDKQGLEIGGGLLLRQKLELASYRNSEALASAAISG